MVVRMPFLVLLIASLHAMTAHCMEGSDDKETAELAQGLYEQPVEVVLITKEEGCPCSFANEHALLKFLHEDAFTPNSGLVVLQFLAGTQLSPKACELLDQFLLSGGGAGWVWDGKNTVGGPCLRRILRDAERQPTEWEPGRLRCQSPPPSRRHR